MKRIRRCDTTPEVQLRRALWTRGIRYRKDYPGAPGRPDLAIVRLKIAVFVDGAFWHGYEWEKKRARIRSNPEYWIPKIEGNMRRDLETNSALESQGWVVVRFWDFEIRRGLDDCVERVMHAIAERSR